MPQWLQDAVLAALVLICCGLWSIRNLLKEILESMSGIERYTSRRSQDTDKQSNRPGTGMRLGTIFAASINGRTEIPT